MNVLIKYLLQDIRRQGKRTLFIWLTLTLVAASMLASLSLAESMVRTGTRIWRAEQGTADILIQAGRQTGARFIRETAADSCSQDCSLAVGRIYAPALLETGADSLPLAAVGADLQALVDLVDLHFSEQADLYPFAGNKAVISRRTAESLGLQAGDLLTVSINGNRQVLVVAALAYAEGPFAFETKQPVLLLPLTKMQACLGAWGKVDSLAIRLRDPGRKGSIIGALARANPLLQVGESYSEDHVRLQANRTQVPFVILSIILCFMALYVLSILFTGIVADRLPLTGVFRALGARKAETDRLMLAESLFYGATGGISGWLAGIGLLHGFIRIFNQDNQGQYIELAIGWLPLLLSLGTAVGASLAAAWICLLSAGSRSISGLIRRVDEYGSSRHDPWVAGLILLICPLLILFFWQNEGSLFLYLLCLISLLSGMIMLIPGIFSRLAAILERAGRRLSGLPAIALRNIRHSRDFVILITILALIVATVIIVQSITTSDQRGLEQMARRTRYQLELSLSGLDRDKISLVRQLAAVEAVCGIYRSGSVDVAGQSIALYQIQGIAPDYDPEFIDLQLADRTADLLSSLSAGRNILLTLTMKNIYQVETGDQLVLKIFGRDRVYREIAYTITGFFDDYQTKIGRYGLISQEHFREDFAAENYDYLAIRSADPDRTLAALTTAFGRTSMDLQKLADVRADLAGESARIISSLQLISALTVIIGLLGVLNTALLVFRRRRRETGLYYAMGLPAAAILRLFLLELLLAGLIGSAGGFLTGLLLVRFALPRLVFALQLAMKIYADVRSLWLGPPVGLLIAAAASLLCLLFLRRSNPMDGLRQEE